MGFTFFAHYKTTIDYHAHEMTFEPIDYQVRDLMKELPDRLLGPKVARRRILAPLGLWGFRLGEPIGGLESPGVPIVEVYPGSAASHAGLRQGDVLITLDGRWTASIVDVFHAVARIEPGRDTLSSFAVMARIKFTRSVRRTGHDWCNGYGNSVVHQ